ncbi:UNVERIFIED_CONTAM: putative U6 snRNA-associated Sm-like protein LSm4 [Sesamum indicum]
MEVMTHSSSFLLPNPSADNGPSLTYALLLLNRRLPRFTPLLWKHAQLRICADGGANRLYDELPLFFADEDALAVRKRYKPDVIIGDMDSIREELLGFYKNAKIKTPEQKAKDRVLDSDSVLSASIGTDFQLGGHDLSDAPIPLQPSGASTDSPVVSSGSKVGFSLRFSFEDLMSRRKQSGFAAASLELSQGVNEEGKARALAAATSELERLFKKEDFKQMKVIGQFNLGFIIGKLDQDLFIVDQLETFFYCRRNGKSLLAAADFRRYVALLKVTLWYAPLFLCSSQLLEQSKVSSGLMLPNLLVELKNGETYNGHLVNCDTWMNIHLREVICTSKDGDRFWRMPECYIRGNTIKYLRVPDEVIDKVQEETKSRSDRKPPGVGRGRGRGREDGSKAKGVGRGMEEGGARGGGRGRGGPGGRASGNRGGGRGR